MRKKLAGELSHLGLGQLFRLLHAAGASGILTVEGGGTDLRLPVIEGGTPRPEPETLAAIRRLLAAREGRFRFEQDPGVTAEGRLVSLAILEELASRESTPGLASDMDVEDLLRTSLGVAGETAPPAAIHHLPPEAPEDPLGELVEGIEDLAPEDLSLVRIGVVAADPRLWRGTVERRWRRHGWEPVLLSGADVPLEGLALLVVHHQLSITRVGNEEDWLHLVERASTTGGGLPVVWVGPLGDPRWVSRLVRAGAAFLLPPPAGESGEPLERFHETLAAVIGRLLDHGGGREPQTADPVVQLAEALFSQDAPGGGVAAVLQMASRVLVRAAVLRVEPTGFRTWAGYGYPLHEGLRVLPRGIALLERAAREREVLRSLPEPGQGRRQLARLLGVDELPAGTCVVPLLSGGRAVALLVGEGEDGAAFEDLVRLAPRLGVLLTG